MLPKDRIGSRLQDGKAHAEDHKSWSRRDFLSVLGASAGGAVMMGGTAIRPFTGSLYSELLGLQTDRVLVLIQLEGGNDGLNTLIPIEDDTYYTVRPNVSISKQEALSVTSEQGFHPSLSELMPLYNEGQMAVLQSVGYPDQDLSHFRSTDIWLTASEPDAFLNTGWVGRSMESQLEESQLPDFPLAVQLGAGSPLLLKGEQRSMGMSVTNTETFERLADSGKFYDEGAVSDTLAGQEMAFVRSVANDAFRYADAIHLAANTGVNSTAYPNNYLAENLSIVAKLIKGNLGARIYHVSLGGFDTHAEQDNMHATLLRYLAEAVAAFQKDLEAEGWQDRVLTMTLSEFGRRVEENGSLGTDHGSAAPLFLFGPSIKGGLYGPRLDLQNLDQYGNLTAAYNFRNVYATILQDWFGFSQDVTSSVIGQEFASIDFVAHPVFTATERPQPGNGFDLHANYPNPFIASTTISFTLPGTTSVRLSIFDMQGRTIRTVVDRTFTQGRHEIPFHTEGLPSGRYFYRLETPDGGNKVGKMTVLK